MINTYTLNDETWVDLSTPSPEEIREMMDTYGIHPFVAKEMTSVTPKPRIEFHDEYIYCILHFPAWKHTHSANKNQEVDFIIGKDTLITARYDTIDAFHKLGKDLEVREVLDKVEPIEKHSHRIFMNMLRELYASVFEEMEYLEDRIEDITGDIFKGKEKEMVVAISETTRTMLEFKKVIDLHGEILQSMKSRGEEMFGHEFAHEMEAIILDYGKIVTAIKSGMETLDELRKTDNSLLTAKQNETIKLLTLVGAICFVLSIFIALFSLFY